MTEQEIKAEVFDIIVEAEKHQIEINRLIEIKNKLLQDLEKIKGEK